MVSKGSYRQLNMFLMFFCAVAITAMVASAVDEGENGLEPDALLSQSNISHHRDDRVRFVPDNLFSVSFVDESHGWAAGYYGTILKTADGGSNWTHISLPNTDLIRRIQFLDRDRGWLVTHRGRIMSSEDGGVSWKTRHTEDSQINLRNIQFVTPDTGWAVGHEGTILYTSDGGETWANQNLNNFTGRDLPRLNGLAVLSETHAMLAGEFGVIAETVDAGKNWMVITPPEINATFTEIEQIGNSILAVGLNGVVANVHLQKDGLNNVPEVEVPARVSFVDSGVEQHFFDIVANENGGGLIVGLANIFVIENGKKLTGVEIDRPDRNYLYFMGATSISESKYVLVGARGLAITLDVTTAQMTGLIKW